MERENTGQREQAPPETYNYLNRYQGIYKHPTKPIVCLITEEQFCNETGGSCMDFFVQQSEDGILTRWQVHVTDKNELAESEGFVLNIDAHEYTYFKPDIADLISIVKDIRSQFDIDPYEDPSYDPIHHLRFKLYNNTGAE